MRCQSLLGTNSEPVHLIFLLCSTGHFWCTKRERDSCDIYNICLAFIVEIQVALDHLKIAQALRQSNPTILCCKMVEITFHPEYWPRIT